MLQNKIQKNDGDFYVGIEWGIHKIWEHVYLFGVIYIQDQSGKGHFGMTQFQQMPDTIASRVYEGGEELGVVQNELCGDPENNHKWGSFAQWTDNMLSRSQSFEHAFYCAIAPFFNRYTICPRVTGSKPPENAPLSRFDPFAIPRMMPFERVKILTVWLVSDQSQHRKQIAVSVFMD